MDKKLLTVGELAKFLNCTPANIYNKVRRGSLEYINYAGVIRFDPETIPGYPQEKSPDQKAEG